jgi:hypothetical protein
MEGLGEVESRGGGCVYFTSLLLLHATPCLQSAKRDTNTFHPRLPRSRLGQMLPRLHSSPHNLSSARGHMQQRSRWDRRAVGGSDSPWTSLRGGRLVSPSFTLRVSVQHPDLCLPSLPDPEDVHSRRCSTSRQRERRSQKTPSCRVNAPLFLIPSQRVDGMMQRTRT